MKKYIKNLILSIFTIILLTPFIIRAESMPNFPMSFWGNLTINGSAAPAGSVLRAYYGTVLASQVVASESGIYGYTESTKQKLVVGEGNGIITFTIQSVSVNSGKETAGSNVQSYPSFSSGATLQKNIDFTIGTSSTNPPASGGGGGGGGGGGSIQSTTPIIYKSADVNGDNKIDKYDFSLMMSNWGKTGSNTCDLNGDDVVDKYDFAILMSKWTI